MFWTVHLIGWLSLHDLVLFLELWSILSFGPYLSPCACYVIRGGALGIHQGRVTHAAVCYCMWGRGPRGNNAACLALTLVSVTSLTSHKKIGSFWCWFPGGWVCVHSRTLWVSPMNSPVRLGVSPAVSTPTGVFSQTFEALFPQAGTLGCAVCLAPQLFLLVCPHANVWPPAPPPCPESSPPSCPSPPFLPDWVNVSLSPWFSSSMQFDFLAVLVVPVFKLFFYLSFGCARK